MRSAFFPVLFAAGALVAAAPVQGVDLPQRKSGLWEITTQPAANRAAAHTVELCIDQKSDDAVMQAASGAARDLCSRNDTKRENGRLIVDSVCTFAGTTATTHSVFTGRFDSAYRVESTTSYEPPLSGVKQGSVVISAKWKGPCRPDQKPGDMILGNGMKININDMPGASAPRPERSPDQAPRQ